MVSAVRQISEGEASDLIKSIYQDTRTIFAVPWVGIIIKVFANYPTFLNSLWTQLKKSASLHQYEIKSEEIRTLALRLASQLKLKNIHGRLKTSLTHAQLQDIEELLDVFNYGNPKFLILAAAAKNALQGRQKRKTVVRKKWKFNARYIETAPPLMIQENKATGHVNELYSDIRSTLKLPFVNSDYKALAIWPTFLDLAWKSLRPNISTTLYTHHCKILQDFANGITLDLPYPVAISKKELASRNEKFDAVYGTVKLFHNLLPGLILNVASFKLLLNPELCRAFEN